MELITFRRYCIYQTNCTATPHLRGVDFLTCGCASALGQEAGRTYQAACYHTDRICNPPFVRSIAAFNKNQPSESYKHAKLQSGSACTTHLTLLVLAP